MGRFVIEDLGSGSRPAPEPFELVLGEETFKALAVMPLEHVYKNAMFARDFGSTSTVQQAGSVASLYEAVEVCFAPADWEQIRALLPSRELGPLANALSRHYAGVDAGESDGSAGSSPSTSTPQTPTSNGSTESTSAEPSTIKTET